MEAQGEGRTIHDLAVVCHVDTKAPPEGVASVTVDGLAISVWRFPRDPYLPGLASATSPARVRELLDRLGGPPGRVGLAVRSYRPARRAVVEVSLADGRLEGRLLYLKVLSGHRAARLAVRGGAVVALLDLDVAGTGRLAQDAGSLVAHLEVIADVWPQAADRARAYARSAAYGELVGPTQLARGVAGAWLGLATGPHRAQDPDWVRNTRLRVASARAWADLAG